MTKQTKQVAGLTTPTPSRPDPEVAEKAQRRRFSATYKERILAEAQRCTEPGELGALLRREGLYSSHLSNWRRQREHAVAAQRRGRKAASAATPSARVLQLERENSDLRHQLEQAHRSIHLHQRPDKLLFRHIHAEYYPRLRHGLFRNPFPVRRLDSRRPIDMLTHGDTSCVSVRSSGLP